MDGPRFDVWTRRRLSFAAGGLTAFLLGPNAAAKKSKKKIRCKKLLKNCAPEGKQERCCSGLNCDPVHDQAGLRCCFGRQHRCQSIGQCCGDSRCEEVEGLAGNRCCGEATAFCTSDDDCCFGAPCMGGACAAISDRTLKDGFGSVDSADMLARVRELPISTWNYTSDDASIRHIGPMAQDFAAIFGVGADDRHIHPLDGQGVALAAIQGLVAQVDEMRQENARLMARIAALEKGGH
jgi:hypothetical protein